MNDGELDEWMIGNGCMDEWMDRETDKVDDGQRDVGIRINNE